jgi:phosphoribosylcarboxyaminoimidazole (NCAIR) mutase
VVKLIHSISLSINLKSRINMTPIVSIIMGSTSDLPVMEKAAQLLNDLHVPFEMNALSAHRTPEAVEEFAKNARSRGIKVIIAAAGMAGRDCRIDPASGHRCTHQIVS